MVGCPRIGFLRFARSVERGEEIPPAAESGDEALVRLAQGGDREAIARLVTLHSPRLYRFLVALTGDKTTSEDALQDTWLRVMERIDQYRSSLSFIGWLFGIARHRALDLLRQRSRSLGLERFAREDSETGSGELPADSTPSALDAMVADDLSQCVAKALRAIPTPLREVILLRFKEGLAIEEIGRALHLPLSTVKSRLYRGLEQLRLRVERMNRHE